MEEKKNIITSGEIDLINDKLRKEKVERIKTNQEVLDDLKKLSQLKSDIVSLEQAIATPDNEEYKDLQAKKKAKEKEMEEQNQKIALLFGEEKLPEEIYTHNEISEKIQEVNAGIKQENLEIVAAAKKLRLQ